MNSISALRNTRTGRVHVLGNSSSLDLIRTCDLVRSSPTIGVNRILRLVPVNWLTLSDGLVLEEELPRVNPWPGDLLIFAGANSATIRKVERAERVWTYGLHTSPWQKNPAGGAPPRPDQHFRYSGNTGTYAIEAAALLGFTEIRMLGIDLRYDLAKTHFFGDGRALDCKLSRPLDYLVNRFRMVFEQLKSRGITLVNESPLEGPLDAVIPREASPWLRK